MRNVCYALTRRNILMVTIAPTYVRSTAEMLRLNLSKSLSVSTNLVFEIPYKSYQMPWGRCFLLERRVCLEY